MTCCSTVSAFFLIDREDEEIVRKLTHIFGEEIWKRTILSFTFTNAVKALYPDQSIKVLVDQYAKKFQSVLCSVCPSFSVVSVFSCDQHSSKEDPWTIVALPVGNHPKEQYVDSVPGVGWVDSIFLEVLKNSKAGNGDFPMVLKAKFPTPKIIRVPLLLSEFLVGTVTVTTVGAGTCSYIGTVLDPMIGELTGKCEIFSCAAIMSVIGVAVVGPLAVVRVVSYIQEHEVNQLGACQLELDAVQKEVKNYRQST